MKIWFIPLGVWLLGISVAPASVSAAEPQQAPQPDAPPAEVRRPYRGLFGGPAQPTDRQHSLYFSGSLFGAYDDDVFGDQLSGDFGVPAALRADGVYGGGTAGLEYAGRGRALVNAEAAVGLNKYSNRDLLPTYRTAGDVAYTTRRRTTYSMSGGLVYSPQFRLGLFGNSTGFVGMDPFQSVLADYDLYRLAAYRTTAGASITQAIGPRSSVNAMYALNNVDYVRDAYDYRSQTAGGILTRGLTRHLSLHAGYSYMVATYPAAQRRTPKGVHNLDLGLAYSRALSVSRRTRFSFSTGSAFVSTDAPLLEGQHVGYAYRFTGSADLTHEMGRTWTANLSYRRGVDFHEGFYDPFLSDTAAATVGGLLSRRVRLSTGANYAFGTVGFGSDNHYSTASATTDLQTAINRTVAAYITYFYYRYKFDQYAAIDPRFARSLDRQGVRVGLMTRIPLIRH
jgi:hypothetical protein